MFRGLTTDLGSRRVASFRRLNAIFFNKQFRHQGFRHTLNTQAVAGSTAEALPPPSNAASEQTAKGAPGARKASVP